MTTSGVDDPRFAGMMGATNPGGATDVDPDGLPSIRQIQSMSPDRIEEIFKGAVESYGGEEDPDPYHFLAKVGVAAQKIGFDRREGRDLIYKAMELYGRDKMLTSGDFFDPLACTSEDKDEVVANFTKEVLKLRDPPDDQNELIDWATKAFGVWIIREQAVAGGGG